MYVLSGERITVGAKLRDYLEIEIHRGGGSYQFSEKSPKQINLENHPTHKKFQCQKLSKIHLLNRDPKHTLFCCEIAFVMIYSLFMDNISIL